MSAPSRRGLSLIEVIVILFILAILIALLLPALNQERRRPRRNQCLNNMRSVGLAVQGYASQNSGKLVPLEADGHSWPRHLLRLLDQPALDRDISAGNWSPEKAPFLKVLVCPEDADSDQQPGGLSYVLNGGYGLFPVDPKTGGVTETGTHSFAQDWDGDGEISEIDREVTRATGVIWRQDDLFAGWTLDGIDAADGTSHTLLVTESLTAGPWTSRDTRAISFVIGRERLTFDSHKVPLDLRDTNLGPFAINGAGDAPGPVPAPSSNHKGAVHVIWVDGRGTSISEEIDPRVYAAIMTPAGTRFGQVEPAGKIP